MHIDEKCDLVVQRCRAGKIVVFEGGLEPEEEANLIKASMENIDFEEFRGIEIYTPGDYYAKKGRFRRFPERRVTVIAPAATSVCLKAF